MKFCLTYDKGEELTFDAPLTLLSLYLLIVDKLWCNNKNVCTIAKTLKWRLHSAMQGYFDHFYASRKTQGTYQAPIKTEILSISSPNRKARPDLQLHLCLSTRIYRLSYQSEHTSSFAISKYMRDIRQYSTTYPTGELRLAEIFGVLLWWPHI